MPTRFANGIRQHFRLEGHPDRPVVILAHSVALDLGMWDRQIAALTDHFRVLRYDMRGHGGSARGDGASLETLGRDVLALADALGIGRFHFIGLSLGGMIGLWLGAHAPARIDRLVIANSGLRFPAPPAGWDARFAFLRQQGLAAFVDPMMERFFAAAYRERDEPFYHSLRTTIALNDLEGVIAGFAVLRDAELGETAARITVPTLILSNDGAADAAGELAGAIAGSRMMLLGSSHVSAVEAPERFNAAVLEFLSARRADIAATAPAP